MVRLTSSIIGIVGIGLLVGPAFAQQPMSDCDQWVGAINTATALRFDPTAVQAKVKAVDISSMCRQGKTAEAEKAAKETMAALGIKP